MWRADTSFRLILTTVTTLDHELKYFVIMSMRSMSLHTPQAGTSCVHYISWSKQNLTWMRALAQHDWNKEHVFFWSTLAANLYVCKHHTNQSPAVTSADWFTTVTPWRQLTVLDIQSPFVSFSLTALWLRRNSHRMGLCNRQCVWTPSAVPHEPPSLFITLRDLCTYIWQSSSNASFCLF